MKYTQGEGKMTTFTVENGNLTIQEEGSFANMPIVDYQLELQ